MVEVRSSISANFKLLRFTTPIESYRKASQSFNSVASGRKKNPTLFLGDSSSFIKEMTAGEALCLDDVAIQYFNLIPV